MRSVHRNAAGSRRWKDVHLQDPQGRRVSRRLGADGQGRARLIPAHRLHPRTCKAPIRALFTMVERVSAPDDETVVSRLKYPFGTLGPMLFDLLLQGVMDLPMACPLDHLGPGGDLDLRHRREQRDHCNRALHSAPRPCGALERPRRPRDTLHRRGARVRLRACAHHRAPHAAERAGILSRRHDRGRWARRS